MNSACSLRIPLGEADVFWHLVADFHVQRDLRRQLNVLIVATKSSVYALRWIVLAVRTPV